MRTSDPDVYAVGDVAAFPLKRYGNTTRQVAPSPWNLAMPNPRAIPACAACAACGWVRGRARATAAGAQGLIVVPTVTSACRGRVLKDVMRQKLPLRA